MERETIRLARTAVAIFVIAALRGLALLRSDAVHRLFERTFSFNGYSHA